MNVSKVMSWALLIGLVAITSREQRVEAGPLLIQSQLTHAVLPATVGHPRFYGGRGFYGGYRAWGRYSYGRPSIYYGYGYRPYRSVVRYNAWPRSYRSYRSFNYFGGYGFPYYGNYVPYRQSYYRQPVVYASTPVIYSAPVVYQRPVYVAPPVYSSGLYVNPIDYSAVYTPSISYPAVYSNYSYYSPGYIGASGYNFGCGGW